MAAIALSQPGTSSAPAVPRFVSGSYSSPAEYDHATRDHEQEVLKQAREDFRFAVTDQSAMRTDMLNDLKFALGDQWESAHATIRTSLDRPVLTINRIPGFISHVVNNLRQARSQIKIDPKSDATETMAEIRQGLIRHIEVESRSELVYDSAMGNLCTMGLAYARIVPVWSKESPFDQDLRIEWVPSTFSVYEDPASRQPDWLDARFRFVVEDITLDEFQRRYGKDKSPSSLSEFRSIGDDAPLWMIGEKIRIAEYFHIEEEPDTRCEAPDGTTYYLSDLEPGTDLEALKASGLITRTRPDVRKRLIWTLMHGLGIVEEKTLPGETITVIPFIGAQSHLEGRRVVSGMVRFAKEAQRMFNYMYSSFVEMCSLAPKAPFIVEAGQLEGFQDQWENANKRPQAYLPYNMKTQDGMQAPLPHRDQAEPPIQAFVQGLQLSDQNLKSTFRIFDASLGQRGPQESGIAINSRKVESDNSTFDWIDCFNQGLRSIGIVLNDLLEHYYNRPGRVMQIIKEDLTRKSVTFNSPVEENGKRQVYDLSRGKFEVTVSTGPSYPTVRQEAARSMLDLAKFYPPLMQVAGPQIVRQMDWPGKEIIAVQLEKAQPPELRRPKEGEEQPQSLPQDVQKIGQLSDMVQKLSELVTEATDKHNLDQQKELWETARTQLHEQTQLAIAEMKTGSAESLVLVGKLFEEMERIRVATEQMISGMTPASPTKSVAQPGVESAPAPPSAAPQQVSPQGANTPPEVGIGA